MRTVADLHQDVRVRFPAMAAKADQDYQRLFEGCEPQENLYAWFESLANALNDDMRSEVPFRAHESLFLFMDGAASRNVEEIHKCVDVAFVENLFWSVPSAKASPYWAKLPQRLRKLYVDFHHREP